MAHTGAVRRAARRWVEAVACLLLCGCNTAPEAGRLDGAGASSAAPASPSASPTPACTNEKMLAGWSVGRLALQTITVPVDEGNVGAVTDQVAAGVGGVILFGSKAPATLGASLSELVAKAPDGVTPFVMSDEEGGAVQRMANLVGKLPSARTMGQTMTPDRIREVGRALGEKLKANGVTMNLAPVLDLDDRPGPSTRNPGGTRSFGIDANKSSAAGLAFGHGLRDAGVVPVVKHFPGLGYATANTDHAPARTKPWSVLQTDGLVPFQHAVTAGLPAIMVSHATIPGLTSVPASLSPEVVTMVLRQQLRFDGLVITDALTAAAVTRAGYPLGRAAVLALVAGADMTMFTARAGRVGGLTTEIQAAIEAAVASGELSRQRLHDAVTHILAAKLISLCP